MSIPNDDDFRRADELMDKLDEGLEEAGTNVIARFEFPIHSIVILWQQDVDFRTYVFFPRDSDLTRFKAARLNAALEELVYDELAKAGRGNRPAIQIEFEYDTDENVQRAFGGDYMLRLR